VATALQAQELNCKVRVMRDKIQGVDKEVFTNLERSIIEFLNTRKWTSDQFTASERIDCNILINVTKRIENDAYEATLNIQATRPVFNSSYTSTLINFIDKDFRFRYSQYTPMQYDDNRVSGNDPLASNLTATLAFYIYVMLGLDYDSFQQDGGTEFFKKAQNIVNNAPEQRNVIEGWKPVESNRNRYWIIDQILSPRFTTLRQVWYRMHREALDNMYNKPEQSRKIILDDILKLSQLQKDNPTSILLQFFFNAKSDEYIGVLAQLPKEQRGIYITLLSQMDVPNAQKYNNLK
jgi:hypothetical protein